MTRIIGGTVGGRRITTPRGLHTRPTSDRVRESLFSAVESWCGSLSGLRVLDLYAGSGALGLEARSRGAGRVTMVEQDRRTAGLISANAKTLGFLRQVDVVAESVSRTLAHSPVAPYDVVFLDPPYPLPASDVDADLAALAEQGWLVPGGLLVLERGTRTEDPTWPPGIVADRQRRLGETTLWYAHAATAGEA